MTCACQPGPMAGFSCRWERAVRLARSANPRRSNRRHGDQDQKALDPVLAIGRSRISFPRGWPSSVQTLTMRPHAKTS